MAWIGVGVALIVLPAHGSAQETGRVRTEENFRQSPNGTILGQLDAGTPLEIVGRRGKWLQVQVKGWTWTRSYQQTDRDGFELVLSAEGGENLRDSPSGKVIGHLERGVLLDEIERQPGWLHVRRRAWIWAASVSQSRAAPAATSAGAPSNAPSSDDTAVEPGPANLIRVGEAGVTVFDSAGGDTVAHVRSGGELRVLTKRGEWARIRLEGWARIPTTGSDSAFDVTPDSSLTPQVLKADPNRYRGRVVAWELQFISLEHAEKVRSDFVEGEPYLLTRFGDSEGSFIYVAVPPDMTVAVQGLVPLERIEVTGRVRTGASAVTGTPIIDLSTLKRVKERR